MKATWLDHPERDAIDEQTLSGQGVVYQRLRTEESAYRDPLDALSAERGYVEQDVVELHPGLENLDQVCQKFVDEHYHDEDEVRFVLQGEGIFDIRSDGDEWMRVVVEPGDLIVVPARRHHRFMLTEQRRIRCVRLFKDQSGWVPHYRSP